MAFALCACGSDGGGNPDGGGVDLAPTADLADDPSRVPLLTPPTGVVRRNGTIAFSADAPVTWSVREARGGSIAATGTYTAPAMVGSFTVVATRVDNPSVTATAPVSVAFAELVLVAGALGGVGDADGAGTQARFGALGDQLAADASGALYVVDRGNATVRRIVPGVAEVTTLAGRSNTARAVTNGTGDAARFSDPTGVAVDPAGTTVFVSECDAHVIRRIDVATRAVTTLAGAPNMAGSTEGATGADARFDCPTGLAFDDVTGWLYVADSNNHTLRRVKTAAGADRGKTELFAGEVDTTGTRDTGPTPLFNSPTSLALDRPNNLLYVVDTTNRLIRRLSTASSPAASATTLPNAAYTFTLPRAVAWGNSKVHIGENFWLARIEDNSSVSAIAGSTTTSGYLDNVGPAARFQKLAGLAIVSTDAFAADKPGTIRRIALGTNTVTTWAGLPRRNGYVNSPGGDGATARFDAPTAVLADSDGTVYVGDEENWRLRKIVLGAAGAATVNSAAGDGTCCLNTPTLTAGLSAKLAQLRCLTVTGRTMLACNARSTSLAKIDLSTADYQTQTIVVSGASPRGVAVKGGRTVYFSSGQELNIMPGGSTIGTARPTGDHSILSIDLQAPASPTRLFGNATGLPDPPSGQSIDGTGTAAWFSSPSGLALDDTESTLFVADSGHHAIRRIDLTSGAVTTIGGAANQAGFADGPTGTSRFNDPAQLVFREGALYIADRGNHVIRRLEVATGVTTTVLGTPGVAGVRTTTGQLALNAPHSVSFLSTGEMLVVFGHAESAVVLAK